MSIIPAQTIRSLCRPPEFLNRHPLITPFHERTVERGMTFGLSSAGYDIRIAEDIRLISGAFRLASTIEHFAMPDDLIARVCDKSSWARQGIAVQNTIIEPGWRGFLTLEITNHNRHAIEVRRGMPIAQIVFERLEAPTEQPYAGKYQDRPAGPQAAMLEAQLLPRSMA